MDRVCEDHAPVVVTRKRDQAVVMLSLKDYHALQETAYLLRSPEDARRLVEGIAQIEEGTIQLRSLDELA
jgi:antitoxin YefM